MIVVTGAAGFIASCLISKLNREGHTDLILVDDFSQKNKIPNYIDKQFIQKIERFNFLSWFKTHAVLVDVVYHMGARTDTTEFNIELLNELNLNYTKIIWNICTEYFVPMIYASSAATYGLGEFGYDDDETKIDLLKPLNPYGDSKHQFDKWAISQKKSPPKWIGFKFFNVYGPNEFHKGRMASVIFHAFNQIQEEGYVKLFKSHNSQYIDGGQLRDFVYVKDVVEVLYFSYTNNLKNGIYNLGSGKARTFLDLAKTIFTVLNKEPNIEFIDIPINIKDKYQYFTEANMNKLIDAGYKTPFTTLEKGVHNYINNYLLMPS